MRFVDWPLGATVAVFSLGAAIGALLLLVFPAIRQPMMELIQVRLLEPVTAMKQFGSLALLLLILVNNSIPPVLSFAYPFLVGRLTWTPALTIRRLSVLMVGFSLLTAFLVGFFGFGVGISVGWLLGGESLVLRLLYGACLHGPVEFASILLCVSEPMRLIRDVRISKDLLPRLRNDLDLLLFCLIALLFSAALEVFVGV